MFLNSINYFRGVAILLIVAGHSYTIAGFNPSNVIERTIANLLTGGTALFVFISGFMFHHVFSKKFNYKKFMVKKMQNVVLPYLILSIYPIWDIIYYERFSRTFGINNALDALLFYPIRGIHLTAYWYIPFAVILFLASPIFLKLMNSKYKGLLITIGLVVATLIHRPLYNINVLQSFIYFSPVYLLGMWASINKNKVYTTLKNKEWIFLFVAVVLAFYQGEFASYSPIEGTTTFPSTILNGYVGNFHKNMFVYNGLDLMILQKTSLCFFFMVFLRRFEDIKIPFLDFTAKYSFAIFFLHCYLILWGERIGGLNNGNIFTLILTTLLFSITSAIFAAGVKKVFPKHSRKLIGA